MCIVWVFALLSVVGAGLAVPLSQTIGEDPELIAGYFQGDIVLSYSDRNGLRNEIRRWPNSTVYYKFNDGVFDAAHRNHILRGMRILEEVSCIRFKKATADQKYYVNITNNKGGCYSNVGWLNRIQTYNLQPHALNTGCFRLGTIVHEFLHTLGFFHMQSAANRDEYVRIATENIRPGKEKSFKKYEEGFVDDFDEEYDYGSVLHYSAYAFSVNGKMTIVPLKDEAVGFMGQRRGLSKSDINKLNKMYRCPLTI
ncbi:seminal metalloprotease 1-like [Rhagoletis pomonella]|uniref:seminal metalloprotease 1-like n=1 Tax=Rhagoletis pomonella TaxID=28610 RepID=UPI0017859137|nr:seminal metalloprotease 1-like [Rhagoletis pomonella]